MNSGGRSDPALFICPPAFAGGPVPRSDAVAASGRPQPPAASALLPSPPSAGRDRDKPASPSPADAPGLCSSLNHPSPIIVSPDRRAAIARTTSKSRPSRHALQVSPVAAGGPSAWRNEQRTAGSISRRSVGRDGARCSSGRRAAQHGCHGHRGRTNSQCRPTRGTGPPSAGIRSDRPGCAIGLPFADRLRPDENLRRRNGSK